jgi:hypothetical protein
MQITQISKGIFQSANTKSYINLNPSSSETVSDIGKREPEGNLKMAVFWVVASCSLAKFTDVSEVLAASIIRATNTGSRAGGVGLRCRKQ